jgi:hypothetical protein
MVWLGYVRDEQVRIILGNVIKIPSHDFKLLYRWYYLVYKVKKHNLKKRPMA